ncbi:MAG TPA: SAM-dependent methyltransferase [Thermoanaerobaculia bacterium]|nr:SAM-dependent methyltransferase [Thermoanaerobaculia bacterium]
MSFRDFVELALYHPESGYYARAENPVGKGGDYVTAPSLSPAFSFAIAGLVREFVRRAEGAVCSFVDIGCGDGSLVRAVAAQVAAQVKDEAVRFFGVDRSLDRAQVAAPEEDRVAFFTTLDPLPRDGAHFFFSNELFDAIPFARLVQRGGHLHDLWVAERDGVLDWSEREAPALYEDYFRARGIELAEGQFADITPEWAAMYADLARLLHRGLIVTIDYGYPQEKLFHPRARRFGTAAAYRGQRVSRDLLAAPGEQDLTAHINFSDLLRAGEEAGARTLFFDRLAKFLLAAGITQHPLFRPVQEIESGSVEEGLELLEERENARRLVLPEGIGEDLRVLVQEKGMGGERWSFEERLF